MKKANRTNRTKKIKKKRYNRYSYALKRKVVEQILKGVLTKEEALLRYEIRSRQSINDWIRKYGPMNYRKEKVYGMKQSPEEKIKELKARIEELETDKVILNIAIDIADEELNTEIRKKYLPQQLKRYKGARKNKK